MSRDAACSSTGSTGARRIACTALFAAFAIAAATPAFAFFDNDPDAYIVNYFTGGGGKVLFAAGTADQKCRPQGLPDVQVLSASPGLRLRLSAGGFVATGVDAGYLVCIGQTLPGVIVTGSGRGAAVIKVTYPPKGEWYTHKLVLP